MEDLPEELTIDILSRLPIKTIIHSNRRVCKKWRNLVLDSSFVNLHFSRSPTTGFIVHQKVNYVFNNRMHPGILKWLELEDKVDLHHDPPTMSLDLNMIPIFQNSRISVRGSANGLICLWQNTPEVGDIFICNPVTREILILPTPPQYNKHSFGIVASGFGVSSLTGEYKVVRTLNRKIPLNGNKSKLVSEVEVYTLGTGQWRSLGRFSYSLHVSDVGAVLNDHCHWVVYDAPESICTFDLNKETIQLFPSPPSDGHFHSLGVLKGCLCISNVGNDAQFTIWVMKEYGIKKSWHKEMVIRKEALPYWHTGCLSLIGGLKDGTIFFVSGSVETLWAFYPRSDKVEEIDTLGRLLSGLAYRPSYLKLQNFKSERVHMF